MINYSSKNPSTLSLDRNEHITLNSSDASFTFLPSGEVFEISSKHIMINQFLGNNAFGAVSNIYLRIYKKNKVDSVHALRGLMSDSKMDISKNKETGAVEAVLWKGSIDSLEYTLEFRLAEQANWFWQVNVNGKDAETDLLYIQDIGLASKGALLTNELYASQYVDQKIFETENGYAVACRQNLNQGGHPYLYQGALNTKIKSFSTDASQFFGTEYRLTNIPKALYGDLPAKKYQFELSCTGLQTEKLCPPYSVAFFAHYEKNHADALTVQENHQEIDALYKKTFSTPFVPCGFEPVRLNESYGNVFASKSFSDDELDSLFPKRKFEEKEKGKVLSFFTPANTHVVLAEKDVLSERPHGHILVSAPDTQKVASGVMTSTNYMYGIFGCQTVCGNTSFNRLSSQSRGLLNLVKNTGQRLFIKREGKYLLLTMPAAYEMGLNFSKWYYKVDDDILCINLFISSDEQKLILKVRSYKGIRYSFLLTNQLNMGVQEYDSCIVREIIGNTIFLRGGENSASKKCYPGLSYAITINTDCDVGDDSVFFSDNSPRDTSLLTLKIDSVSSFETVTDASEELLTLTNMDLGATRDFDKETKKHLASYNNLLCGFKLSTKDDDVGIDKLNHLIYWYAHNATIHFSSPHGLEQCGGAAWGTRDVCQGPAEMFLALGHFKLTREIILKVFSEQFASTGEWPQWFMYDKYPYGADDCHGDVVFWPVKLVADYIMACGDYTILDEVLPFRKCEGSSAPVREHIKLAVKAIYERFIGKTGLITYAGGDWDDTLQPVNQELKSSLISSWTVALAYQTLHSLSLVLEERDKAFSLELSEKCRLIYDSFSEYLIKDGVIAGFGKNKNGKIEPMIHPLDSESPMKYRLLPMTRSILADLVSPAQAKKNIDIIEEKLLCPDGARLMDAPAPYNGGVSKTFARAEQCANIGREISLQYVHAHIRYIEALSKMGLAKEAWNALNVINPIRIIDNVPNATLRQANAYFSSSEGAYLDRYDYAENFSKLRTGDIDVRAGWRIYSSGPGLFISRLIINLLGYRIVGGGIEFDPVLTKKHDGLEFKTSYGRFKLNITYRINGKSDTVSASKIEINGKAVNARPLPHLYKSGGLFVEKETLYKALKEKSENQIVVTLT